MIHTDLLFLIALHTYKFNKIDHSHLKGLKVLNFLEKNKDDF